MDKPKIADKDREAHFSATKHRTPARPFSVSDMAKGGPIFIIQPCSMTNQAYRDGYDKIKWNKE